jgi:hypothetical protein
MSESHGGSIALSGYIFQLLAVTGVQISAGPGEKKAPVGEAFVVRHEWLDEDAVVADPVTRTVAFIQVKYSENAQGSKISTGELKRIVKRFARATTLAQKRGWHVGSYLLLSNRGLSEPSKRLLDFSAPAAKKSTSKKKGKTKAPKTKSEWPKTQIHVAKSLTEEEISADKVKAKLKAFAAKHGVLDSEFTRAINELLSTIFNEVAGLRDGGVTIKEFIGMLTGTEDAVSIARDDQDAVQNAELVTITAYDEDPHEHLPRERTKNLLDINPQHSCFVFYGKGGMGKTASLRELARQHGKSKPRPFVRGILAIDAQKRWATGCADLWRKVPTQEDGTVERAIKRLKAANPTIKQPILLFALDGIDETFDADAANDLRTALKIQKDNYNRLQTVSKNDFKLVVTCRDLGELEKYLPHDAADMDRPPLDWLKTIEFKAFDADEFREIVNQDAGEAVKKRLVPEPTISTSAAPLSGAVISSSGEAAMSERYLYLRDPLVWRSFIALTPEQQEEVLDEKDDAACALGKKIFERFVRKTHRRRTALDHATLLPVMRAVAIEMEKERKPWTRNAFCEKGRATGVSLDSQCREIFGEATEAGLIDGSAADWKWRNSAIPKYLQNAPV